MIPRPRILTRGAAAAAIAALLASPLLAVPASAVEGTPEPIAEPEIRGTVAPQPTDRFIVKFKDVAQANSKARGNAYGNKAKELGVTVQELKVIGTGATVVETSRELESGEAQAFVESLEANSTVEYAEPDQLLQASGLDPVDYNYEFQWPIFDGKSGIDADAAWESTTGTGMIVAVIDTGITSHVDLNANVLPGYDMISDPAKGRDGDGRDPDAQDEGDYGTSAECAPTASSWHGTHVAGIIAAVADSRGIVGIAPTANILPVRVLAECGGWTSDVIDGLIWASGGAVPGVPANPNPAQVVNLSLSGSGGCTTSWQSAINSAVSRGSVVVAAAGNAGTNAASVNPANCANVIAVAASGKDGAKAGYSNYGDVVDVVAPGGNMDVDRLGGIISTVNLGNREPLEHESNHAYALYQGTSMAAPHVAATAALMLSVNGSLSPATVEHLLKATTKPLPIPCEWGCGTGLINARAAVDAAITGEVPVPPEPGTVIVPGPLAITGTPVVDGTLTAEVGAWEPAPVAVSLQWYRNGELLPGATGTTYKLTPADAHRSVYVVATGTKPGFFSMTKESAPTGPVQPGKLTSAAPRVYSSGGHVVGTTLTIDPGTWQPAPVDIRYQWYRGTEPIPNATGRSYTLATEDVGKTVRADVYGAKPGYFPASRGTTVTNPVQAGPTVGTPTISGTPRVGQTLTASPGTWSPAQDSFTYRWFSDGQAIINADGANYRPGAGDYGKKIRVTVTGTRSGAEPVTVASADTTPIASGILAGSVPAIKGSAIFGQTLTAEPGAWSANTLLEYRWFRDGTLITGANQPTYAIAVQDIGRTISVHVIGSQAGYDSLQKESAPTAAVTAGALAAPTPTIIGTATVGSTLTANTGAWTAGTTLSYQWYRQGTAVEGATGSTYTLTAADAGKTIRVNVTGSRAGYLTTVRSSNTTAPVTTPVTRTAIDVKYAQPGIADLLGKALGGETTQGDGARRDYERGSIVWSESTGAIIVRGAMHTVYIGSEANRTSLGFPTAAETAIPGGAYQQFQNGGIFWSAATGGQISLKGAIREAYNSYGAHAGFMGFPTSNEISGIRDGGHYQTFQNGTLMWSPSSGAHLVFGGMRTTYVGNGSENGALGYPTGRETAIRGGAYQQFQNGGIFWSAATGGQFMLTGPIREVYNAYGAQSGFMGFPTSNEISGIRDGGHYQTFQNGTLMWSARSGAHLVFGGMRTTYVANGSENGALGYPTGPETAIRGGAYQQFQNGGIFWSAATGGQVTLNGPILDTYKSYGAQSGFLGYPTSGVISGLRNGGRYQAFQNGAILWSQASGAHLSFGGIRDAYAGVGLENGRLGYPTSSEYGVAGGVRQNYQGGYITWTNTTGGVVTFT